MDSPAAFARLRDDARNWTLVGMSLVFLVNLLIMWNTETVPAVEAALPDVDPGVPVVSAGLAVLLLVCSRSSVRVQRA
ncbi:hypothetical protein GCM10027200_53740 [Lentzea nigeriaca]